MRRRTVDRYKLALIKAAELDDTGFDWRGIDLTDPHVRAAVLAADPVASEAARRAKKVCQCKSVDVGTIEDAIRAHGLSTVEGVRTHTNASGGCGACAIRIEEILAEPLPAVAAAPALRAAE